MKENRIKPTHFMEVWQSKKGIVHTDGIWPIKALDKSLKLTKSLGHRTIQVWKIREIWKIRV